MGLTTKRDICSSTGGRPTSLPRQEATLSPSLNQSFQTIDLETASTEHQTSRGLLSHKINGYFPFHDLIGLNPAGIMIQLRQQACLS
ncbi:hypothetical protein AC579_2597 [Pseudocercospora musae]|uniref:Uncharacterized protein n=1 Tax=Pseudocercospora musae TaxID=113226 RepID=A0A139IEM0_9PEZI|nr:hypothetical protein AC579_2597 [Pseudocercospora musae]